MRTTRILARAVNVAVAPLVWAVELVGWTIDLRNLTDDGDDA